ncbi:hypothetical protein EUV02_01570 [Polymorphobacter arshaanensis]|uniref:Fungal lipase-type domain-containing protein n=1 Tax=Glacieibacterium arshaanense TaxID=2511025 RepID=A0A4Y9EQ75_9SPHN|nr:hypothetical protein [Polymorphobacter arshaanensis]TFU05744.1 hypothetical protein EUV02_01570 [Polymorphobacter arshaanensis]
MVDSLHRRLMYLCNLSYELAPGAIAVPVRPGETGRRDAAIGLGHQGAVIARNAAGGLFRDVALVGHIPEGIVIAARGTMPPDPHAKGPAALAIIRDWLNDGNLFDKASNDFVDRVHGGFAASAIALCGGDDGIKAVLTDLLARDDIPRHVFVTGHSKGGPVANLIAWAIRARWGISSVPVTVVTFAAARTGNAAFRADFNSRGIECTRYEAFFDQVPKLPLGTDQNAALRKLLDHFGIKVSGDGVGFVGIGSKVEENPFQAIFKNAGGLVHLGNGKIDFIDNLEMIVKAHSIGPETSYDGLVQ